MIIHKRKINNMEKKLRKTAGLCQLRDHERPKRVQRSGEFHFHGIGPTWVVRPRLCRTYEVPEVARPQTKQLGLWCLMMFGDAMGCLSSWKQGQFDCDTVAHCGEHWRTMDFLCKECTGGFLLRRCMELGSPGRGQRPEFIIWATDDINFWARA